MNRKFQTYTLKFQTFEVTTFSNNPFFYNVFSVQASQQLRGRVGRQQIESELDIIRKFTIVERELPIEGRPNSWIGIVRNIHHCKN